MCAPSFFCNPTNVIFTKKSIAYIIEVVLVQIYFTPF